MKSPLIFMHFGKIHKQTERKDNQIKMSNVNAGVPFKISWKKFKDLDKVCSVEGKNSDSCKNKSKEYGIDWVDDE